MTAEGSSDAVTTGDFDEFMRRCHEALRQQGNGHSQPFLELWSATPDVTLMAAVGGVQLGFDDVSGLLSHVSNSLNWDGFRTENLATRIAGDLAFTAELERMTRTVDGHEEAMTIRATQIYHRVDGDWKVIHRHGDVLTAYEEKW
jgi:ketosteroid isomerase-like protein